jgi:hypothetical protein
MEIRALAEALAIRVRALDPDAELVAAARAEHVTTALDQIGRFRGQDSFAGWLFQITPQRSS